MFGVEFFGVVLFFVLWLLCFGFVFVFGLLVWVVVLGLGWVCVGCAAVGYCYGVLF